VPSSRCRSALLAGLQGPRSAGGHLYRGRAGGDRPAGWVLLLRGEIAKEQLMPKNFTFYNPDEHKRIIRAWRPPGRLPSSLPPRATPTWPVGLSLSPDRRRRL